MNRPRQQGFTIVELMLVVGIIGILAAVGLPAYQDYTVRARVAEGLELALAVEKTVGEYRDRWGALPRDNAAAGLPAAAQMRGSWVSGIEIQDGAIVVSFVPDLVKGLQGRPALVLRPASDPAWPTGALVWVCQSRAAPQGLVLSEPPESVALLPNKYLPSTCRST